MVYGSLFTVQRLKIKKLAIVVIIFALSGCANVTTIITDPAGKQWTVQSKSDARVIITQDKITVEVDNRGKTNWIEGLMQYILAKPDIKLANKNGLE